MRKKWIYVNAALSLFLGLYSLMRPCMARHLDITIMNLAHSQGEVAIALFNQDQGFPYDVNRAYIKQRVVVDNANNTAHLRLTNLPDGSYAIAWYHDHNLSHKFETNWLGKPSKQYGFSGQATVKSTPSFQQASFVYPNTLTVELQPLN